MEVGPLAVALGDPAGIGPEIVAKAWDARGQYGLAPFFAVGDQRSIESVWSGPIRRIASPEDTAGCFDDALPLLQITDTGPINPGQPDLAGARCALDSLELAAGLARSPSSATRPLTVTRPSRIHSSMPRRDPWPALASSFCSRSLIATAA